MIERVKAILLTPKTEWPKIAAEPANPGELITRYALPLIAIGPVAGFLGGQLFGYGAFGFSYKPSLMAGLSGAIVSFVAGLIGVVVLSLIADFLAPKFGGEASRTSAFKLVVYSLTAGWVGGIFGIIPSLALIGALLGLYSLYLLYLGATPLLKVPSDKAVGFTAVTIVCAIVLYFVIAAVTTSVVGLFGGGAAYSAASSGGEFKVPGVGTIDTAKIEAAGKQMQDIGEGKTPVVAGSALQGLLPAAIGDYQRTAVETNAMGRMGSEAEGTYTAGDKSFRLKVVDMAALGALAGMGAALGVEQSREDADSYERTTTVDGGIQTEEWHRKDGRGKFGTTVGNRFMVEAEGQAASIDELKAAVATIDPAKLAALAQ